MICTSKWRWPSTRLAASRTVANASAMIESRLLAVLDALLELDGHRLQLFVGHGDEVVLDGVDRLGDRFELAQDLALADAQDLVDERHAGYSLGWRRWRDVVVLGVGVCQNPSTIVTVGPAREFRTARSGSGPYGAAEDQPTTTGPERPRGSGTGRSRRPRARPARWPRRCRAGVTTSAEAGPDGRVEGTLQPSYGARLGGPDVLEEAQLTAGPQHPAGLGESVRLVVDRAQHQAEDDGVGLPVAHGRSAATASRSSTRSSAVVSGVLTQVRLGLDGDDPLDRVGVVREVGPVPGADLDDGAGEAGQRPAPQLVAALPGQRGPIRRL